MREEQLKSYAKVSCPCGNAVRIDPMSSERSLRCPRCSYLIDFVVTVDKATKRPKVSIVVAPDAIKGAGESLAAASKPKRLPPPEPEAPPPPPAASRAKSVVRGVFATCLCGEEFPVDDRELTTIQPCPRCGVKYHVVVKIERDTKKRTAMLVPVEGTPPPPRPRVSQISAPRATRAPKRTRVTHAPKPRATAAVPPGAQAVVCSCGESLVARRRDVEAGLTCGACGKVLRLMEDRDPQTLAPRIRLRPDPKK